MIRGDLFVISAPSGAGKTSLVKVLTAGLENIVVSVSHTTRAPRPGEMNGRDYHFVERTRFEGMLAAGAFLEHAQVFDHFYGTTKANVDETLAIGLDVILEIDWQGARKVREAMPGCVSIFILPPSLHTLEGRLRARGQDSDAIIARRMRDAIAEMSHYLEYDYLVVNDDFELAAAQLTSIFIARRLRRERQTGVLQGLLGGLLATLR